MKDAVTLDGWLCGRLSGEQDTLQVRHNGTLKPIHQIKLGQKVEVLESVDGTTENWIPAVIINIRLLSECHTDFQKHIRELAVKFGQTEYQIYKAWTVYADSCTDQSVLLFEFEQVLERKAHAKSKS